MCWRDSLAVIIVYGIILFSSPLLPLVSSARWTEWHFPSTHLKGIDEKDRSAKPGDVCYYPAWSVHTQPILEAMRLYVAAKKNPEEEFQRAKAEQRTTAPDHYEYLWELAKNLNNARLQGAANIAAQLRNQSLTTPYNIEDTGMDLSQLLRLLCEGGQLLVCKQRGNLELGFCQCFDLPEGSPLYTRKEEDGMCKAPAGATCDSHDPVITTECLDLLRCQNYSQAACKYGFGPNFHCDGNGQGFIGSKNSYCYRASRPPEHDNDAVGIGGAPTLEGFVTHLSFVNASLTLFGLFQMFH